MTAANIDARVHAIGKDIFARLDRRGPFPFTRRWLDEQLMGITMEHPALKVQLFRFVDTLPYLNEPTEVSRHLREYLNEAAGDLPWWARWGRNLIPRRGLGSRWLARAAKHNAAGMARKFIAGSNVPEAIAAVRRMRQEGLTFTIDLLGEATITEAEADAVQQQYHDLLDGLTREADTWPELPAVDRDDRGPIPRVNVSVKLSGLYSQFDPIDPEGTARGVNRRLRPILRLARDRGAFVNFDMEQFSFKDTTLFIFKSLLSEPEFREWPHVGIAIQAYLTSTEHDLNDLLHWAKTERKCPVSIRLVKGAYWDYETVIAAQNDWPVPVFTQKWQSDVNFEKLSRFLLANCDWLVPAFGSHNIRSISHAIAVAEELKVPPQRFEFQMLYGMADPIKDAMKSRGHRIRVYTPYGQLLPGMAYLVRRLLENTSNDSFLKMSFMDGLGEDLLLRNPAREQNSVRLTPSASAAAPGSVPAPGVVSSPGSAPAAGSAPPPESAPAPGSAPLTHTAIVRHPLSDSREQLLSAIGGQPPAASGGSGPSSTNWLTPSSQGFTMNNPTAEAASPVRHGNGQASSQAGFAFRNAPLADFARAENREAMANALRAIQPLLGRDYPAIIDNREVSSGEWIESVNPSHAKQLVGRVTAATPALAEQALASAKKAFERWRETSVQERAALLRKVAQRFRERHWELCAWITTEVGKPWREADADVAEAIDFCEYYALKAEELFRGQEVNVPGETNLYFYEPRGIAVVIAPWNFPLAILCGMAVAAVVTGNTVILKPAEQSSVVAAKFMEVLREAGLPPGVVNFLPGIGETIGPVLTSHPDVALIAFTGSLPVALAINETASRTPSGQLHVKKVIAEMGGKNAVIVDSDADLDEAVKGVIDSAFGYSGQKCSAGSRAIVIGGIYDQFLHRLIEAARSITVAPAEQPGCGVGPVIDAEARQRIRRFIDLGKKEAKLAFEYPLGDLEHEGFYVGPTIFADVPETAVIAQEEIFGPVLSVMRAKDLDDALRIANGVKYALTGGIFSRSPENIAAARRRFRVGNLYINRKCTGALVHRQPFGGFKLSGIGSKAGGPDYLLQFVLPRVVTENTLRRGFAPET